MAPLKKALPDIASSKHYNDTQFILQYNFIHQDFFDYDFFYKGYFHQKKFLSCQ